MLGMEGGGLVHVAARRSALSAVIASSAAAFTVVKLAGAAYFVYLGVRRLVVRDDALPEVATGGRSGKRLFVQGIVVNVLDPRRRCSSSPSCRGSSTRPGDGDAAVP